MPSDSDNLIAIAKFHSSAEAAIARSRLEEEGIESRLGEEATATWFWHLGTAAAGIKLIVHEYDAPLARHLLGILPDHLAGSGENETDDLDDEDEDWVGEDWADTDKDYDEPYTEEDDDPLSPERLLTRAWRASVIGVLFLPPLLTCYSAWLILQHKLWQPLENQSSPNWRFYGALVFNSLALPMIWFWWDIFL